MAQAHYSTLLRLKQYFPFSLIDAMGGLDECRAQIARELRYQSSLDLDEATCAFCRMSCFISTCCMRNVSPERIRGGRLHAALADIQHPRM